MRGAERLVLLLAAVLLLAVHWVALLPRTKQILFTLAMLAGMLVLLRRLVW